METQDNRVFTPVLMAANDTPVTALAGCIAKVLRTDDHTTVQAIGAGAVNQAVKAISTARGYLEQDGIDAAAYLEMVDVDIDGRERTAMRFLLVRQMR